MPAQTETRDIDPLTGGVDTETTAAGLIPGGLSDLVAEHTSDVLRATSEVTCTPVRQLSMKGHGYGSSFRIQAKSAEVAHTKHRPGVTGAQLWS